MTDVKAEEALEATLKEISKAPRVTLDQVNANIKACHFFTAQAGVFGTNAFQEDSETPVSLVTYPVHESLGLLTICVLVLQNGFIATGESACASPENYNKEIGEQIAKKKAMDKVWEVMGYELRQKLHLIAEAKIKPSQPNMQAYVGTKVVNAIPMNRGDYNEFRGWALPENENGADEGYLVEYTDKEDGQVPDFKGYVSWSPKDVFERAYMAGGQPTEQTALDRLKIEYDEVRTRWQKLYAFLGSDKFKSLDQEAKIHLDMQQTSMANYMTVLGLRIKAWKD